MFFICFFFKQKTAYEMRISDWSSTCALPIFESNKGGTKPSLCADLPERVQELLMPAMNAVERADCDHRCRKGPLVRHLNDLHKIASRSEEHTSELQSLMRISYAVFCLKKKRTDNKNQDEHYQTSSYIRRRLDETDHKTRR